MFLKEVCPRLTDTGYKCLPTKVILEAYSRLSHVLSSLTKSSKKFFDSWVKRFPTKQYSEVVKTEAWAKTTQYLECKVSSKLSVHFNKPINQKLF